MPPHLACRTSTSAFLRLWPPAIHGLVRACRLACLPIILAAAALLLGAEPAGAIAGRPVVAVVATAEGDALDVGPDTVGQKALLDGIAAAVLASALDFFPCMNWIAIEEEGKVGQSAAALRATVRRVQHSSNIELVFYARVGQAKEAWLDTGQTLILRDVARDPQQRLEPLRKLFGERIAKHFEDESFRDKVDLNLISKIPIARVIYLTSRNRIVVPVDAAKMRLAPRAAVVVELVRPICKPPVTDCGIDYSSVGIYAATPWNGMLSCLLDEHRCCDVWPPPELASSLSLDLPVYLGAAHKHCPYGQPSCEAISRVR